MISYQRKTENYKNESSFSLIMNLVDVVIELTVHNGEGFSLWLSKMNSEINTITGWAKLESYSLQCRRTLFTEKILNNSNTCWQD